MGIRLGGILAWAVAMACLGPVGCGSESCVDRDGDGYGVHCADGPDCDDDDDTRHIGCVEVDCTQVPSGEGCACQGTAIRSCFSGLDGAQELGVCQAGKRFCNGGVWSACDGQVLPSVERCNGVDEDCDGRVDEGVLSPCGGCNPDCRGGVWGGQSAPFTVQAPLEVLESGYLSLTYGEVEQHNVWVANTDEMTLSRVDGAALQETARYRLPGEPKRIAVDYGGAALVLSLSETGWTLTKVAGVAADCAAEIPTSSGPTDLLPSGEDGCVLWTRTVAEPGGQAMGLAVDGARSPDGDAGGNAWVATGVPPQVQVYRGADGEPGLTVALPVGVSPQDATFDLSGRLWVADREGILYRLDYTPDGYEVLGIPVAEPCFQLEALAFDDKGHLYLSTYACESVLSFDHDSYAFRAAMAPGLLSTRGLAWVGDSLFVAHTAAALSRVQLDPWAFAETVGVGGSRGVPVESQGVSVDSNGLLWITSRAGGGEGRGLLSRFDTEAMKVTGQVVVGKGPRALGDFTGSRLLGSYAEEGTASKTFTGCGEGVKTAWLAVHTRYRASADAEVLFEVRQAERAADLASQPWLELGGTAGERKPISLAHVPKGGVLSLRMTLRSGAHLGAPIVEQVGVQWSCPGLE